MKFNQKNNVVQFMKYLSFFFLINIFYSALFGFQ